MTKQLDLSKSVTVKDLMEIFEVNSLTTIWQWRKNKGLDKHEIRIDSGGKYFVRFTLDGVKKWAKANDKEMTGMKSWEAKRSGNKPSRKRVRIAA